MDLIPAPSAVRLDPRRTLPLGPDATLSGGPGTEAAERWLRAELGAATGLALPPAARPLIELRIDEALAAEEYRITVDAERALLTAGGPAGAHWAAQTLRQLLGPEAHRRAPLRRTGWALPLGEIADAPRFRWRGLLIDTARHFLPKPDLLRYVDLLAAHKLNVLHLHLTDDQGWRFEVKRCPRLTEVGSWRTHSMVGFRDGQRWDDRPHGGFYTQDDLRELVAYAADRGITVVPEIDLPGHNQAAIAAYPELGNTDVVDTAGLGVWTDWGVSKHVLNASDATLAFYEGVLEELLEVFPSEFVHIGGDECPKDEWRASPAAQARIRELGVGDEDGLQSWMIRHFDRWLAERGRRLIGWDEILEGGLAPGAAVSSWRGFAGGTAAARAGHQVVICPEQHVYLDHRQGGGPEEPIPIGFVRTLEDVYRFEPVPADLDEASARQVMGTQATLFTEFADSPREVDFRAFPRLAALAEVAWSALPTDPAERDWPGFERRMRTHLARLDALGVGYRPPAGPHPWQQWPGVVGRPLDGPPPVR
ncbi:beta-N-acetylhexosaminidase [Kitasatospora viridis]|uniref:beta-N-acetylhexosaminidase n=1 Tax=Kitasatospora viridis TaxID=281105 RepID=A0A561UK97_9ACTN|nr:beta-N-acetylhexosaminidase [Kitasatospora viridis]TWF99756.1 hexosaminidase [Kitasatospora viridis]